MESLDKITLQLLSNKNQYKKYLSKEDPAKFREHQEYLQKIKKYRHRIMGLTKEFLENPDKDFNLDLNEMFSYFAKTMIKYCELKDLEKRGGCYEKDDSDSEEDTMFSNSRDIQVEEYNDEELEYDDEGEGEGKRSGEGERDTVEKNISYWGSTITKQTKSNSRMDSFFKQG